MSQKHQTLASIPTDFLWMLSSTIPIPTIRAWRTGTTAEEKLQVARFWTITMGILFLGILASILACWL